MAEVNVAQWQMLGTGNQVIEGSRFTLWNVVERHAVRYGEREYGINLVWDDAADLGNVSFHRRSSTTGPVKYGEQLALRVEGGGFVRYSVREWGINLSWSSTAVHEWEITGGQYGQPVPMRRGFGLYNRLIGDHVIYGERSWGINLRWWSDRVADIYNGYTPLPMPPALRAPSGEPGQILLQGTASEIELFHGGTDDELDWHIYIRIDERVRKQIFDHLTQHVQRATRPPPDNMPKPWHALREQDLDTVYCEWMVLDGYDNSTWDEKFYSADVSRVLALAGKAWDYSAHVANQQNLKGASIELTDKSELCKRNARVWLQGAFVNDAGHWFRVEIHPLDSLAYALDSSGTPVSGTPGDAAKWPDSEITWRVAAFTNSSFHRINKADFLRKERTVVWYLPLPDHARLPGYRVSVTASFPAFRNEAWGRAGLDKLRPTADDQYKDYGIRSNSYRIEIDPQDGLRKLRVTIVLRSATDEWGAMFLGEYRVTAKPPVVARKSRSRK
jgi:hypothetical protein